MIERLRPYPKLTLSGADWLPALPGHWELHRAKASFREVDERSLMGGEELLSVSHKTGVTPRSQKNVTMFMAETYEGHKTCQPGDIVVNTMWAWMAALGTSRHVGIVSPAYGVYRQRGDQAFDPRYLDYLLRTEVYRGEYLRSSRGITASRLRLYPPDFLNIPFIQPPLGEQRLIVRFLDWHGAMTGKLIRAKRRLIALLNEQKQSIIHRAVTRGLDPAAKLKATGVDAIGDVPEHWMVKPLKWLAAINTDALGQGTDPDYEFEYLDIGSVGTGFLAARPERMKFAGSPSRARRIVQQHDTIVSTVRTYLKAIYYVSEPWPDLIASTGFAVLRPREEVIPEFFGHALESRSFIDQVVVNSDGVAYPAINETRLGKLVIAVPPSRDEQAAIVAHLAHGTERLRRHINATQREIDLILEFRTRLIADVVTGQFDVRAIAASLPGVAEIEVAGDLTDEDDLNDDAEALIDEEEAA